MARGLSANQERRLRDFLDESLMEINGEHHKRYQPSAELSTLHAYLERMREVVALVLQIPPVGASASLRTVFLLRITGDIFNSIPGYSPDPGTLHELMDWLDDLDQAWICVLRSQVWDPVAQVAVDLTDEERIGTFMPSMSQTERIRLHSLLIGGAGILEEWLTRDSSLEQMFGRLEVQDGLDNIFSKSLEETGIAEDMITMDTLAIHDTS